MSVSFNLPSENGDTVESSRNEMAINQTDVPSSFGTRRKLVAVSPKDVISLFHYMLMIIAVTPHLPFLFYSPF